MEVNKLEGKTLDGVSENVSTLAQAFPEVIVDGKVDFEKLRLLLGEDIDDAEERYSFSWPGKRDAIKLAISRTTGTLRPDKANSKDWDTTKNLFIEGDNLEVLRVLQNTYRGKVKMIYIDPPYNTGKDFVYKDDFKDNIANYKEQAGLAGQSNADTSGRYHTNWLNMMYPRLRLAKNLLKEDGVIFISIDDNEVHNLRRICDEVCGEDNLLGQLIHQRAKGGGQAKYLVKGHDYVLAYARNINVALPLLKPKVDSASIVEINGKKFIRNDDVIRKQFGKYDKEQGDRRCFYEELEKYKGLSKKQEVDQLIEEGKLVLENFGNGMQVIVEYTPLDEAASKLYSIIKVLSEEGTKDLEGLSLSNFFDYPKPVEFIKQIVTSSTIKTKNSNDIVLDFFAGSATTAHAVLQQNIEDGGNRRFILVQLPETISNESNAGKAGYKSIADISRERVRRAGEKVKQDYAEKLKERTGPLDIGFKAFTLDTTNFREWDTDTENIEASLLAALETFKEGRDSEDALYEVLLKYGVDLAESVEVLTLAGKQVYSLAGNYLLVCLEKKISLETIEAMAKLSPSRVVCYDDGFDNDEVKQNALETLKRAGVEDVRVI